MSIRDTSAQDTPVGNAATRRSRQRRQWWLYAAGGLAMLLVAGWLVSGWAAGSRSVSGERLRIAEVTRGTDSAGAASADVLSAAQLLSGESQRLKAEMQRFLATVRAG